MISREAIRRVIDEASKYEPPLLSLYLNVNPAEAGNSPKALATRAKSTLDGLKVPSTVAARVVDKLAGGASKGRTAAVFANETQVDVFFLHVELPLEDTATGRVESRWGKPYVTPLLIAMDENEHYGVVHVDRDHVRLFEISLGSAEVIFTESRLKTVSELDTEAEYRPSARPYIPVRSDASSQLANEHVREVSRLFYIESAKEIGSRLEERGLSRVILVGPTEDTHRLERQLPERIAAMIALHLPSLPYRRASEAEVLQRLAEPLARLRNEREDALLDRIENEGITGAYQSLYALQEGRLQVLVVPWPVHLSLCLERRTGYRLPMGVPEGSEPLSLSDFLPELASSCGAEVEFVLGEARERLAGQMGGLAGLTRW